MSTPAAAPVLAPNDVSNVIHEAWKRFLNAGRFTPAPHPTHVWASSWRVCERRMVLEMVSPEQQIPYDEFTLARFRRGNDRERDLLADLTRMGRDADPPFDVIGQQGRFDVRDRSGRQVIRGKVDAFLKLAGVREEFPIEVKAWSPLITDRLNSFADVFENPWTRSGGYQLLVYLYAHGLPVGFLLLDRSGIPKLLPVVLEEHLGRCEEFLLKAERCVDHAQAGTLPPFLEGDAAECQRCPFYGTACNPPLGAKDVTVITDEAMEWTLTRWHELREAGKEWCALDRQVKQRLHGLEQAFCGSFSIRGRWGKSTRVELPPDVRKQYTVTDPKGNYFLDIEKVATPPAEPLTTTLQRVLDLRAPALIP